MCSQADDPTTYDDDLPDTTGYGRLGRAAAYRPRRYVLSGDKPDPSIALAVLGTMLSEAEDDLRTLRNGGTGPTTVAVARAVVDALRRARNRVAAAESRP